METNKELIDIIKNYSLELSDDNLTMVDYYGLLLNSKTIGDRVRNSLCIVDNMTSLNLTDDERKFFSERLDYIKKTLEYIAYVCEEYRTKDYDTDIKDSELEELYNGMISEFIQVSIK